MRIWIGVYIACIALASAAVSGAVAAGHSHRDADMTQSQASPAGSIKVLRDS